MVSFQDVGLLVLFACGVFAGFLLGYALGWFYNPHEQIPPGMVRKTFLEWFLELLGLQRIKKKPLSNMVIMDKDLVIPRPPAQELGKGVILSADYETGKVIAGRKPGKSLNINFEQE